jgi:hypothetical protein
MTGGEFSHDGVGSAGLAMAIVNIVNIRVENGF